LTCTPYGTVYAAACPIRGKQDADAFYKEVSVREWLGLAEKLAA
jgi:hypothetical protein